MFLQQINDHLNVYELYKLMQMPQHLMFQFIRMFNQILLEDKNFLKHHIISWFILANDQKSIFQYLMTSLYIKLEFIYSF